MKMKLLLSAAMALNLSTAAMAQDPVKVVLLITGMLGDKAFYDSADNGMKLIKNKYGENVSVRTIEMGLDQAKWELILTDVSSQDYDLVITGTFQMIDALTVASEEFPDQKYILFDAQMPYDTAPYSNIYSINYKQNEGSYLGGMLAAGLLKDGTIPADKGKALGILGGMENPIVSDFMVGFIAGAQAVYPEAKIAVSYIGSFTDAAKGKEAALAQYNSGVALGFPVAAGAGLGLLAAAKDVDKFVLGVDADQAAAFEQSDPEISKRVVSSVLKRVDESLLRAYDLYIDQKLPFGSAEAVGLKELSVGLVETGNFEKFASPELKAQIDTAKQEIIDGKIVVPSGLNIDLAGLNELINSVRP